MARGIRGTSSRRNKRPDLGNIAIGVADTPVVMDAEAVKPTKEQSEELEAKIAEYRKENPEKPKETKRPIESPLNIKRVTTSLDDEYIELAKRYLGIRTSGKPSLVEFAKGIIRLFEDNAKMYKKLHSMPKNVRGPISAVKHVWEHGGQWN